MPDPLDANYLFEARHLAAQFTWRLLSPEAWAAAAAQVNPQAPNAKAIRCALFAAYAPILHEACSQSADSSRRDQAYRELYDYLWRQAYYWNAEAAPDIAQEAIILVFRSFAEPGLARCSDPATFLDFAQARLRAARTNIWRERRREGKHVSPAEDDAVHDDEDRAEGVVLAESRPGPEEGALQEEARAEKDGALQAAMQAQASSASRSGKPAAARNQELDEMRARRQTEIQAKTEDERRSWSKQAIPQLIAATLQALQELWQTGRLHRQLTTVIYTYVDRVSDEKIALRLGTKPVNVQPLRSRGLDKLAERLYDSLAFGQGG